MLQNAQLQSIRDRLPEVPARGDRTAWLLGRGAPAGDREAFFVWQERALDNLLAWGVGNMLAGTMLAITGSGMIRGIGAQAVLFGTVETAVALYGSYWARQHAVAARAGMISAGIVKSEADRFTFFVAINSAADVAYIVGGTIVAMKTKRPWLRGAAIGAALHGCALLANDVMLTVRTALRPETRFG